jgi:glucose-6-phosphate dehydrogenase assembly protein OpcA
MAPAVAPLAIDEPGTWRRYARTSSISSTLETLSRLWAQVATEAAADEAIALEAGDARLAAARAGVDGAIRVRTRTSVLTLVVVAPRPEVVDRAMAAVSMLAARHPSRAVVLSPTDPDGPATFEAHVFAACHLRAGSGSEICTEEILIKVGGELAQHLSSTAAPLLIHDLPVVLWWPDDVPFDRPTFAELAEQADRLFVDSGQFRGNGLERLRGLAIAVEGGLVVHDVSWMRLMLWRELLASCFDHPLLLRELRHLRAVHIDVAHPGAELRLSRAALFVGWLMARLRLTVHERLRPEPDGTWVADLGSRRRQVSVTIRPVEVEVSGAARSAGSLVRVALEASRPDAHTVVNVTRQADHLLATADWNGAPVTRRASQLERFDEVPYLAESLDRTGHERIFAQALEKAVSLLAEA